MNLSISSAQKKLKYKRANAKQRGIVCTLSTNDLIYLYAKNDGVCDYTGVPFDTNAKDGSNDLAISIERIDDKKGYIKGNCCLVTVRANQLKDVLFDKLSIDKITFKREAISDFEAMRNKLTPEYLEFLKKNIIQIIMKFKRNQK